MRVADRSSFGNPGNGMECKVRDHRRGADPPKNESGMTGGVSPYDQSCRSINSGNGTCIDAKTSSNCQLLMRKSTSCTRLLCPSATVMLLGDKAKISTMMRGKAGQTSSVSLARVLGVQ